MQLSTPSHALRASRSSSSYFSKSPSSSHQANTACRCGGSLRRRAAPEPLSISVRPDVFATNFARWNPSKPLPPLGAAADVEAAESPAQVAPELWQQSVQAVASGAGLSEEEANEKLLQGFGWPPRGNKFWRGRKVKEVPQEGQVAAALEYLKSLGLEGADLTKVIKTFPEALACSIDDQLKQSVQKLENDWKLKNQVLVKALARQPQVLGYDYDCEGSCQGECNRCWARF